MALSPWGCLTLLEQYVARKPRIIWLLVYPVTNSDSKTWEILRHAKLAWFETLLGETSHQTLLFICSSRKVSVKTFVQGLSCRSLAPLSYNFYLRNNFNHGATSLSSVVTCPFIELQHHSGRKGSQEVYSPTFCSKQGLYWIQTTLLRVLSSLGNLWECSLHNLSGWPVLRINYSISENCFPYTWWGHLSSTWAYCLLSSYPAPLERAWLCLLNDLWGRLLLCSPQSSLFLGSTSPVPSASPCWRGTPAPNHLGVPSLNSFQVLNIFLVL